MKNYSENDESYTQIFNLINKTKLKQIERYSTLAAIQMAVIGGYSGLNISELITDSPILGIAALVTGATVMGYSTKKKITEIGKGYVRNKHEKDLDDFVKSF
jgi:nucleoside permease NupC